MDKLTLLTEMMATGNPNVKALFRVADGIGFMHRCAKHLPDDHIYYSGEKWGVSVVHTGACMWCDGVAAVLVGSGSAISAA